MEAEYNRWLNFPDKSIDYYLFNQSIEFNPVISDNGEPGVHLVQDPVYSKKHYVYCDKEISPETPGITPYSVDWPLQDLNSINHLNSKAFNTVYADINSDSSPDDYTKDLIEYNDSPPETTGQYNDPTDAYNPGDPPYEIDTASIRMDCQNGELDTVTSTMDYDNNQDGYYFEEEDIMVFHNDYVHGGYYDRIIIKREDSTLISSDTNFEGIHLELVESNLSDTKTALKATFPTYDSTWAPLEDPLLTQSNGFLEFV